MKDEILLNIQIIQCKPNEICNPTNPESKFYGYGLGYVYFHLICVIITCSFYTPYSREQKHISFCDLSWFVTPPKTWFSAMFRSSGHLCFINHIILAYLGAYDAHMFALRVWVGFGASWTHFLSSYFKSKHIIGILGFRRRFLNYLHSAWIRNGGVDSVRTHKRTWNSR